MQAVSRFGEDPDPVTHDLTCCSRNLPFVHVDRERQLEAVLPGGMNGRHLDDAARIARPDLKVLFITGYAENAMMTSRQLEPGMAVLTKPFAVEALGSRIQEMISAPSRIS